MSFGTFLKLYLIAFPAFMIIDLIWLGIVARGFYKDQMGHLMRPDVNWAAAIVFYLIFVAGIVVLAAWPGIERGSFARALWMGAFVGLVTYAAYDLTNLATLAGFPLKVAVVDLCWGMVLCAAVSGITYQVWGLFG
jgi:uncharacterized membrane protein